MFITLIGRKIDRLGDYALNFDEPRAGYYFHALASEALANLELLPVKRIYSPEAFALPRFPSLSGAFSRRLRGIGSPLYLCPLLFADARAT
jgi:hypothetical protein